MTTLEEQEHLDIDELYGNNNLILDTRTESYEDIDFQDCAILADICIQYIGKKNLDGKLLKSMISMLSPKKRRSRRQHAKDDAWIESYSDFGHCNVSKADNANLHLFVVAKKDAFRNCNLNGGKPNSLSDNKIKLLCRIGFEFGESKIRKRKRPESVSPYDSKSESESVTHISSTKNSQVIRDKDLFKTVSKNKLRRFGQVYWGWRDDAQIFWPCIICDPMKIHLKSIRKMVREAINGVLYTNLEYNTTKNISEPCHNLVYFLEIEDCENEDSQSKYSFEMISDSKLKYWEKGNEDHVVPSLEPDLLMRYNLAMETARLAIELPIVDRVELLIETIEEAAELGDYLKS